jgi:ATP-dependent Lon protease
LLNGKENAVSMTIARTRAVYDLLDVQDALDRSRGRSPELEAFYERMLDAGPERFVTTPSSIDALSPCSRSARISIPCSTTWRATCAWPTPATRAFNVMPILLLGGPGVGKTHFAKRLARAMGTDCELISMNALSAGFVITGSSASWRGAKCGKVAERLVRGQYANPVVVLDEVEKASGSSQSDPLAALYQLLEPETSRAFRDEFIDVEIDASQIFWVLTANSTEGIPAPLLNRMAVYEVPAPTRSRRPASPSACMRRCWWN